MTWLVFDCASGASGDMTLGALVDLGVPLESLRRHLATLPLEGFTLRSERVTRNSIAATKVHVDIAATGAHPHRHLLDILELLQAGRLSERALGWAVETFRRLAVAEAAVHGVALGEVHFHEVGAVDAIVDIAGACVGIDLLCNEHHVGGIRVSQLRVGRGKVRTEHGSMPVPPPAVLRLIEGFPMQWSDGDGERLTPTGAALLATLARPLERAAIRVQRTGYGAGTKEYADAPNVLRLLLCEPEEAVRDDLPPGASPDAVRVLAREGAHAHGPGHEHTHAHSHDHDHTQEHTHDSAAMAAANTHRGSVAVLRTTIDDMVPEFFGHVMERLFAAGALDVFFTPVQMKKQRPATELTVIATLESAADLATLVLNETTTLGVRVSYEERFELERRSSHVHTRYGEVQVKVALRPDGRERVVPEYESVRRVAEAAGVPLADVYGAALAQDPKRQSPAPS